LLLGIFFISVTMTINPATLIEQPVLVLGSVLGIIAVKAAVVAAVAPLFGLRWPTVVETALLTGPGGEFGFVALGAAAAVGALPGELARNGTLIIAVSMFALPFISAGAGRLNRRMEAARPLPPEAEVEPPAHDGERVLIVGFGRVGQLVADMLEEYDVPYIAVDSDANLVARRRADGKPVYYGNAERPEFLRRCGIANAKALVVTMDAPAKVDSLTQIARAERDDLIIVARARDEPHARQLYRLGVTDAVPETTEASLQLGEAVLDEIGIPIGIIIAGIHQRREDSRRALGRKDRRRKAAAKATAETKVADKAGSQ
jgi:monovalent cation:H+ antiporter-2, CPA2 family